ncbi:MAG: PEGA domain-containing protein [Methanoregulaceae archaeon]|nr:PEGA domain-containing protein [Methanoregulaceae archaeon]
MYKISSKGMVLLGFCLIVLLAIPATAATSEWILPRGNLCIESEPIGATVFVDGHEAGITPVCISDLRAGMHRVALKLAGYQNVHENVWVSGGGETVRTFVLRPLPVGNLSINSVPEGASIYLDGTLAGTTPALLTDIPRGKHLIVLKADGYRDLSKKVMVIGNMTRYLKFRLHPVPSGFGNLSISSKPPGASIYLDGALAGTTPALLTGVAMGKHTMTVNLTGYRNTTRMVMVISDKTIKEMFVLHKEKNPHPNKK